MDNRSPRQIFLEALQSHLKERDDVELKAQAEFHHWPFYIGEQVYYNQIFLGSLKPRKYRVVCEIKEDEYWTLDENGGPHKCTFNSMRAYAGMKKMK